MFAFTIKLQVAEIYNDSLLLLSTVPPPPNAWVQSKHIAKWKAHQYCTYICTQIFKKYYERSLGYLPVVLVSR